MKLVLVRLFVLLACASARAQEITLEEVRVEGAFVMPLPELPPSNALQKFIERLRLQDEQTRTLELREANKSALNSILDLTRYSPIPLGGSDPRTDTFFQQNYMRADLNPRDESVLFRANSSRKPR